LRKGMDELLPRSGISGDIPGDARLVSSDPLKPAELGVAGDVNISVLKHDLRIRHAAHSVDLGIARIDPGQRTVHRRPDEKKGVGADY
jgi:hypothetical protein